MPLPLPVHLQDEELFLVKECKRGHASAQKKLYEKYCDLLLMICLRYLDSREDAQEVLMDVFLNAFKRIEGFTYAGQGSLSAWLRKITVNQCLMKLRRQQPQFRELPEMAQENLAGTEDILAGISSKEILLLIQELPPGYRAVFNLYVFEEKSHKEIATLLEVSEQTSKSQLHRARALLQRQILKQQKKGS